MMNTKSTKHPVKDDLLLKLDKYMTEHNPELKSFMIEKDQYARFARARAEKAFELWIDALEKGSPSPEEEANEILFCGIENSIYEHTVTMMLETDEPFFQNLEKTSKSKRDSVMKYIIDNCIPICLDHIDQHYSLNGVS